MTTKTTVDNFLTAVRKSGLIAPDQLTRLLEEFRQRELRHDSHTLANELVASQALTRWQADKLLEGKHSGFFLGKYRLLSLLGKGGMSSVYLAEHVLMRRRCAIKVLPTRRVNDSSYLGRFHREAQAVAALDHSNIVRAYDVDQETQRNNRQIHFLVMEYVEGQSLLELVQNGGPLDFVSAADYVRQSAEGLAHAHAAGMVHRDVKPGNLLVESSGTVKILDLGLARFFRDKEDKSLTVAHDEKVLGTADYLAPEQARDSHGVDARADIYSLGCTFYFLLTGHPPFSEGTLAQRLLAHQVLDPPPITNDRPDTPPEIVQIVERMMSKDPDERYQDAQDVADVLVDWLIANAGEEWRRRNPGLSGSGSGGSDVRRAAEAAATEISRPASDETSTAGMAVHVETANAPDSSLERDAARAAQPAPAKIARPQFSDAPSGDDSALAMFLTKLTDTPPPTPAAARESHQSPQAGTPDRAAPADRASSQEPRDKSAAKPARIEPRPDRAAAQPAVPVARAIRRPAAPSSNGDRPAGAGGGESQETLLEMPALQTEPATTADTRPAVAGIPVAAAVATATPARPPAAQPGATRPQRRQQLQSLLRSRPNMLIAAGLGLAIVLVLVILALMTGPSENESRSAGGSGKGRTRAAPAAPVRDPRKLLGKDITVGPAGTFKTINEAVDYVGEHFRPKSQERQVIRVAGGTTYSERIELTGKPAKGGRGFPRGVSIICAGGAKAMLEPVGREPVLKLDGVERFRLEGFELRGQRPTAVELSGHLEGTQLKNLEIAGFEQVGVLAHEAAGALAVGRRRNELVLEDIVFRASGPNAVGVRLEGETGRVEILGCRFLQPMASGVEFAGDTRYTQVRHSIFERVDVGVRIAGSNVLKSFTLAHNTFYGVNRGVVFSEMPQSGGESGELEFHRNLFDQVASAEMLVEAGFDPAGFPRLLAGGGPDQNWTTRNAPLPDGAIDLFSVGGRQGATVTYVSTEPGHSRFLAPAPDSPQTQVPADPGRGLQPWVGAVEP